ncbi:MAG: hypothetical protein HY034_03595, partial [Nitrospirae bacterium]|nr:hypothetical protein [Nitrospirota bacterium]
MVEILNPSNYFFNHHAVAPAFVALVVFCAGLYVFLKERKELPNISFFIFCLTISIWLSGMALLYSTVNPIVADIIFRYYVFFGVVLMPPIFYLLTSSILNQLEKSRYIAINFFIAIAFYIINLKTNHLYLEMQKYDYGYYPFMNYGSYIFLMFFYITVLVCFNNYIKNIKN